MANRTPTRSGGVLFALSGLIFSIMTGVLYIIPYIFINHQETRTQFNFDDWDVIDNIGNIGK